MSSVHARFVGSIPEVYDAHLGPLLFEFSAADLAARVGDAVPEHGELLEVACGTGISTEHLRRTLPDTAKIRATDLNEAMVDFAEAKRGALNNVAFEPADGCALPYPDARFDAVACQFGVMFFPDKAQGFGEMARVLKPGGMLAFNVWDSLEHNPVAQLALDVIGGFFESDPPSFYRLPFGFAAIDPIKQLLHDVGFKGFSVDVVTALVERPDPGHVAHGLVEGNPISIEIRERATAAPEAIIAALTEALESAFGPAPLQIPLQEIVFTAVKPG